MIWTIIAALVIFSVIIFVHELGHFLAARMFGVRVNEFAIGMGPTLFKRQGKQTLYSVRAIPMGGFCALEGENGDEEKENGETTDPEEAFYTKKPIPKIIILAAGAAMNLLLGFLIVTSLVCVSAAMNGGIASTVVQSVEPGSDAAGFLQEGDKITAINGRSVHIKRDLSFELSRSGGEESTLTFKRDGKKYTETFMPMETQYEDGSSGYIVGFNVATTKANIFSIIHEGFFQTVWMVKLVFVSIGMLFSGEAGISDMSGPVGVVSAMNTMAQSGWFDFLFFAAFLAVNIGIMNLLPLPALDGGRIFFVLVELVRRKPISPEKEGVVHFIGFVLLIALMLFVTWHDVVRLIAGG